MSLWSGSLFAFTSPIDAILDRDDFTLQELLEEDELLQEMKSNNTRLIDKYVLKYKCRMESHPSVLH